MLLENSIHAAGLERLMLPGTAVVSGGSSGIGLATVEILLQRGATVHVLSRGRGGLDRLADDYRGRLVHHIADLSNISAMEAVLRDLPIERIDYLVPNAGVARVESSADLDGFDRQLALNHSAAIAMFQALRPLMAPGSTTVFLGTFLREKAFAGLAGYIASKAALTAWVRTLAAEAASGGLRINLVSPGPTNTPIWQGIGLTGEEFEAASVQICQRMMPGRFLQPTEVAEAICFLLSPASSGCWGQDWLVDGGYTAT